MNLDFLGKDIAGVPFGVWAIGGAGALALGFYVNSRRSATTEQAPVVPSGIGGEQSAPQETINVYSYVTNPSPPPRREPSRPPLAKTVHSVPPVAIKSGISPTPTPIPRPRMPATTIRAITSKDTPKNVPPVAVKSPLAVPPKVAQASTVTPVPKALPAKGGIPVAAASKPPVPAVKNAPAAVKTITPSVASQPVRKQA